MDENLTEADMKAEAEQAQDEMELTVDTQMQAQAILEQKLDHLNARMEVDERYKSTKGSCQDVCEQPNVALKQTDEVCRRVGAIEISLRTRINFATESQMS